MFNPANVLRDIGATIIIWGAGLVLLVGGGVSSNTNEEVTPPIHAGATITAEEPNDAFVRGGQEKTDSAENEPVEIANQTDNALMSAVNSDQPEIADDTKEDPSETDSEAPVSQEKPPAQTAAVAMDADQKPVNTLTEEQIKERLEEYRKWVHQGEINIELAMDKLNVEQVASLTDFYVVKSGERIIQINKDGKSMVLLSEPDGRLITDLFDKNHWHPATNQALTKWRGNGPKTPPAEFIALNDKAELYLYRILSNASGNAQPESGAIFLVEITPVDSALHFEIAYVFPPDTKTL